MTDLVEELREAAWSAVREAGLSTAYSDGSERGAAKASGKYPPSLAEEEGGKTITPVDAGAKEMRQGEITQRQAPLAKGVGNFSTGGPAPSEYLSGYNASDGSHAPGTMSPPSAHVSDDKSNYRTPGPPDHVVQSVGERYLEAIGFPASFGPSCCGTCNHLKQSHAGGAGLCMYCGPKGSEHTFTENQDLSPAFSYPEMQLVGLRNPNPADPGNVEGVREAFFGTVREAHYRLFSPTDRALIMLDELIEAGHVFGDFGEEEGPNVTKRQANAARDRAEDYGAHSMAAHRASLNAYMSGNKADHGVAAAAHDLACDAACKAAEDYPDSNAVGKGFRTADNYHKLQGRAHRAAASAIRGGKSVGLMQHMQHNMGGGMYGQPSSMY